MPARRFRRALYFLRQACGADLVVGRGDEEVGLDAALIRTDATEFDQPSTPTNSTPR
ncbi:MAG: hypothetical protein R2882_08005 [Gemmatimonadales bacterium]